jgi:uncharacterized protein
MPGYLSPGVYVEEFAIGATPIEGVGTSTAGFIGMAEKGESEGLPVFVSSINQFQQEFGEFLPPSYGSFRFLSYAVASFFTNGGSGCYVMRVVPSNAVAAFHATVPRGVVLPLSQDAAALGTKIIVPSLRGIDTTSKISLTSFNTDGTVNHTEPFSVSAYNKATGEVTLSGALVNDYPLKISLVTVTDINGAYTAAGATLRLEATSKGAWGNNIYVQAMPVSQVRTQILEIMGTPTTSKQYRVNNKNGFYIGAIVEYDNKKTKQYTRVAGLQDDLVTFADHLTDNAAVVDTTPDPEKVLSICEFALSVFYMNQQKTFELKETFANLSMFPDAPNYCEKQINNRSAFISVKSPYATAADFLSHVDPFDMPTNAAIVNGIACVNLSSGTDGTIVPADMPVAIKGLDNGPGKRTGIEAFKDIDDVSIMAVPGVTDLVVQMALIAHCENAGDRFAVLDMPDSAQTVTACKKACDPLSSSYAALYHPWIQSLDPLTSQNTFVPPSGAVMGIYARCDQKVGVHKAPANEDIRDANDLMYRLNQAEQDQLNPHGINVIRVFPGRGIRVWGARTLAKGLWQYVNVRRLFIYLEKSIYLATQWVVFEPNDIPLWARVKQTIVQFLTDQWRAGMLAGATADEAFFVKCDRTTMSQGDIDNGRLICVIGVAPVKPAEFVIFRIAQWTAGAKS